MGFITGVPDCKAADERDLTNLPDQLLGEFGSCKFEGVAQSPHVLICNQTPGPNFKTVQVTFEPLLDDIRLQILVLGKLSLVGGLDVGF